MKLTPLLPLSSLLIVLSPLASAVQRSTPKPEIKFGLEALTSWRSDYIYRGFQLADNSMEFQLAGQIALSNTETIDLGIYHGSATGTGDFSESAAFIDFSKNLGDLTYTAKLAVREYTRSSFKSGADIGASIGWKINDSLDLTTTLSYDTGAEGFYLESKVSYFKGIDDASYLTLDTGASAVANYYGNDGFHHLFATLSYTYNISDAVSVSPYLSTSIGLNASVENHLIGGIYFAVSF